MSVRSALTATMVGLAAALVLAPAIGSAAGTTQGSCREPSSLAAIQSVPGARRASCFGSRSITFTAWGWDLFNVWPGLQVPDALGTDFALATTADATPLWVFLPPSVALPNPTGTPWENRDGIAPGDAWWRVTGHFDDPLAAACVPVEGDTIDDIPVVKSVREVRAFCRNHFVIDRLVWLPGGPPDTDAEATAVTAVTAVTGRAGQPGGRVGLALALGAAAFLVGLRWPSGRRSRRAARRRGLVRN
jgi:hypothetical protein